MTIVIEAPSSKASSSAAEEDAASSVGPRSLGLISQLFYEGGLHDPDITSIIHAHLQLAGHVPRARVVRLLQRLFGDSVRFHSTVSSPNADGSRHWVPIAGFSVDRYLSEASAESEEQVREFIASRMIEPFPIDSPLWNAVMFYIGTGSSARTSLVLRVHHCIADGNSLQKLFKKVMSDDESGDTSKYESEKLLLESIAEKADYKAKKTDSSRHPAVAALLAVWYQICIVFLILNDVKKNLWTNVSTSVFGRRNVWIFKSSTKKPKFFVTSSPKFPLEEVKKLSKQSGVTVNDIFVSVILGALTKYAKVAEGMRNPPNVILAVVANIGGRFSATKDAAVETSNLSLPHVMHMPANIDDSSARLTKVSKIMEWAKYFNLAFVFTMVGVWLFKTLFKSTKLKGEEFKKSVQAFDIILSNVPMPSNTVHLDGLKAENVEFFTQSGSELGFCGFWSYAGKGQIGINLNVNHFEKPKLFEEYVLEELKAFGLL